MFVRDLFTGVRFGGKYHGMLGVFVLFINNGGVVSPVKLVSRVSKLVIPKHRRVFIVGDVSAQSSHELALFIGDLLDTKCEVIVELRERGSLGGIHNMPSWVIMKTGGDMWLSERVDEVIWIVNSESSLNYPITVRPALRIPVSVVPRATQDIPKCFRIVESRPGWKFFSETTSVLRKR